MSSEAQLEAEDSHREGGTLRLIINSVLITLPKNPLTDKKMHTNRNIYPMFQVNKKK